MAQKINQPIQINDFSSGLIDNLSVSRFLTPNNAVNKAINVVFNRPRGSVRQRLGTTKLGNTISSGNTILGLHNFRSSSSANHQIIAAAGGNLYYLNSSTWTSTLTGLSTNKTRFLTYLDSVCFLDGATALQSWDGTSGWIASAGPLDISNFPITKYAGLINTRIAAAGNSTNPDTLYISSLEAANAISWTSGNKTIRVYPNDGGGNISGLAGNGRIILVFKERGLYRYDDTELQRIGFVGTTSHESITTDDNGITYFFGQGANGVGFYMTDGGKPIKISRPIVKYIEAISPSFYSNIAAYADGEKVEWSVGSITINGLVYTNASLVYFPSDQTWMVFNRDDRFRVFSQYIDASGNMKVTGGDTDGMAQTINDGNTDNTVNISSECEFKPITITTSAQIKLLSEVFALATHFQGLQLHLKIDEKPFVLLGDIKNNVQNFTLNKARGHKFQFKITAINGGEPFQFDGLEIPSFINEGYE